MLNNKIKMQAAIERIIVNNYTNEWNDEAKETVDLIKDEILTKHRHIDLFNENMSDPLIDVTLEEAKKNEDIKELIEYGNWDDDLMIEFTIAAIVLYGREIEKENNKQFLKSIKI